MRLSAELSLSPVVSTSWCLYANILPYYLDSLLWLDGSFRNACNYKNANQVTGILFKLLTLVTLKKMMIL